ncbi:carbonic anhydrase family protein [Mariniradius sediminis]|uniref:Carbonic anhydrase n=1 Tax=Mariniradius sediminis TaxID=2909237 RepID=A0ABS9BPR3_9BACT|nr:carbonic anhydrase family protein [Mariniradius sediminis]MCF1750028.1 carbonic anhydrase family protein [Mariniradius sediminis]
MKTTVFPKLILGAFLGWFACSPKPATETTETTEANEIENTAPDAQGKRTMGYALPGLEHGLCQSPINIQSASTGEEGKHLITLDFKDEINKVENLGHTVQLDFAEGSTITVDDTTFNFKQFHFHTPSEHQIDGITYPMEMHIVNLLPNEDKNAVPQYLVIGILFKEGKESKFINDFLAAIPKQEHETAELKPGTVKIADLVGTIPTTALGHYYHYKGSLTTPPYTESVRWYIAKHVYEASSAQIEAINKVEGNNARHVQALYGRAVLTK